MKKKSNRLLTISLLILCVLLTGCSSNSSSSKIITSEQPVAADNEKLDKPSLDEERKILASLQSSSSSTSSATSSEQAASSSTTTSSTVSSSKASSSTSSTTSSKAVTSTASSSSAAASSSTASKTTSSTTTSKTPSPSCVLTPVASGTKVLSGNGATIDVSNSSKGYVMAKCSGVTSKVKFQVKTDSMTYNYDLNTNGTYEVFPLQMGNCEYTLRVMKNVSGSSYTQLYSGTENVTLKSSLYPYLYPNQYVNFSTSSAIVPKASTICAGCTDDIDKLKAVYNWMITNISYDYAKASSVSTGYLPNVDSILSSKKGICFDYAALMAAMLRSQGIPTQLVIGSAGAVAQNHAWNEVYLKGTGWITVKIQNTSTGWKLLDPTFGDKTGDTSQYAGARKY